MIGEIRSLIADLLRGAHTNVPARLLVLGDPGATTCSALAADGHDVWCCPDRQRRDAARHIRVLCASADDLVGTGQRWDVIVAVDGFRRLHDVRRPETMAALMAWCAEHATAMILEAPRRALAPDLHDFGPYRVRETVGEFRFCTEAMSQSGESATSARPLLVASNHGVLVGSQWIPSTDLVAMTGSPRAGDKSVQSFSWGDRLVKIEWASEDYFERCEALREAHVLATTDDALRAALDFPVLHDVKRGRAVNVVVRDLVDGRPLQPGACALGKVPIEAVVDVAVRYAECRLFHNDLRPWNLLWTGRRVVAIDVGDCSPHDDDVAGLPQVVALAGIVAGVMTQEVAFDEEYVDTIWHLARVSGILERWSMETMTGAPWGTVSEVAADIVRIAGTAAPASAIFAGVVEAIMGAMDDRGGGADHACT